MTDRNHRCPKCWRSLEVQSMKFEFYRSEGSPTPYPLATKVILQCPACKGTSEMDRSEIVGKEA